MVIPRSRSALSLSKTQAKLGIDVSVAGSYRQDAEIALTIFEGTFSKLCGFLLELFDRTLVDTTALVDQVTSGGRFSRVDVTDNCKKVSVKC